MGVPGTICQVESVAEPFLHGQSARRGVLVKPHELAILDLISA